MPSLKEIVDILKDPQKRKHLLFVRRVRTVLFWLKNIVVPGCKNVPLWTVLKFFFAGMAQGTLWQNAKGLAYSFLMAIPPLLIFLFTLVVYLPFKDFQDTLMEQIPVLIPPSIYTRVEHTIIDVISHRHTSWMSIGFLVSIFLAANGMHGMLMSFNEANKKVVERRPIVQRYALCFMLVFLLYFLVILVVLLQVGYKYILAWMLSHGVISINAFSRFLISFLRWVILAFFALMVIGVIYYWAPAKKQRVGFFSIGTVLATGLLFLLTWGFQVLVSSNMFKYNFLYGSIGTLLLIMFWIFLNCLVLLIGYQINIAILQGRGYMEEKTKHRLKMAANFVAPDGKVYNDKDSE